MKPSNRFANLDFSDKPLPTPSRRFQKLDWQEGSAEVTPNPWSWHFHKIGEELYPENKIIAPKVVDTEINYGRPRTYPELSLVVEGEKEADLDWRSGSQSYRFDLRNYLLKNGIFKILHKTPNQHWVVLCMTGDIGFGMDIAPKVGGNLSLQTREGAIQYDSFYWIHTFNDYIASPEQYVLSTWFRWPNVGNLQFGVIRAAPVRELLEQKELPFEVLPNRGDSLLRITFTGPSDKIRKGKSYQRFHKKRDLTWGVHYYYKAHEKLQFQERWGGCMWPSEEEAEKAINEYLKTGELKICANIHQMKDMFPDHPTTKAVKQLIASGAW